MLKQPPAKLALHGMRQLALCLKSTGLKPKKRHSRSIVYVSDGRIILIRPLTLFVSVYNTMQR